MKKLILAIGCLFLIFIPLNAQFGWAKKIGKGVKKGVKKSYKVTKKIVTAPTKSTYNAGQVIIGRKKPKSIITPYTSAGREVTSVIPNLVNGLTYPERLMMNKAQSLAYKLGGNTGAFILDLGTFTNQYYPQLTYSLAKNVDDVARGRNPVRVVAAPLAAAIRAARDRHWNQSLPIPYEIKRALRGHFSNEILNKARYTIGRTEITLTNFIGKIQFGKPHAVTVGDLIVFNTYPSTSGDLVWWAHELAHVEQYRKLGIEEFAWQYMKDLGKNIEREAERKSYSIF